jgi:hypothetical protein
MLVCGLCLCCFVMPQMSGVFAVKNIVENVVKMIVFHGS